eukprot:1151637-Pelagomonas_calceolata.AAC.6
MAHLVEVSLWANCTEWAWSFRASLVDLSGSTPSFSRGSQLRPKISLTTGFLEHYPFKPSSSGAHGMCAGSSA